MNRDILYPLRRLHGCLHETKLYWIEHFELKKFYSSRIKKYTDQGQPFMFLVMTPEHGNLGDHAIALSEISILNQIGINYLEITGRQLSKLKKHKLLDVMNGYPILINGGGNLGTLWFDVEKLQRFILEENSKSKIIVLPNTIFYEDTKYGKQELNNSIRIYGKHNSLTLCAREKTSYEFMKEVYRNVVLIPDMVLKMKPEIENRERSGCLLCLRNDLEKTMNDEQYSIIKEQVNSIFDCVKNTDMVLPSAVSIDEREEKVYDKFKEFSGAELVVTDRLHGMIFCAVTGTPCLVINSKSPKVKGCYEWIKHLDYIRFVDDVSKITEEYAKISKKNNVYDNSHLDKYYEDLKSMIKNMIV